MRYAVAIAVLTAFFLEVTIRILGETLGVDSLVAKSVSFVSLALLCAAALYLIFMIHRQAQLRWMVLAGVAALLLAQGLSVFRETSFWHTHQSQLLEWGGIAENLLMMTGVVILLATFYFALIEMVLIKAILQREQTKLRDEIGERIRAEDELRQSRDELRRLTAHVQEVRELERARIARELHDELGQNLTALRIDLERLKRQLHERTGTSEPYANILASLSRQVDIMVGTTRRIVTELHPAILDDLGLHAALEWLTRDFQTRTKTRCTVKLFDESLDVAKEKATAIFRIAQECLTNVARHAEATHVQFQCTEQNGWLELVVEDNGRGITGGSTLGESKGFGILGMRERVTLLGGRFTMESQNGAGTRVEVAIPFSGSEERIGSHLPVLNVK